MAEILQIVIRGDATNFTRTVSQVEAGIKRAQRSTQEFGHSTVSSVQAASASIRLLEGGIQNNVRAVERFITTIPGVGAALKAAFPVVGALAFAGLIAHTGEEVVKFIQNLNQMPAKLNDSFTKLTESSQLANDELRKTNDNLDNQIAKLQGKPQNVLAEALDEARIQADNLAKSLENDYDKVTELLKANSVGITGQILGKADDRDVNGNVTNFLKLLRDAGRQNEVAIHSGHDTPEAAAARLAGMDQIRQNAIAYASSQLAARSGKVQTADGDMVDYSQVYGNQEKNNDALSNFRQLMYNQQDQASLETHNVQSTGKLKRLEAAKAYADQQKQLQEKIIQQLHTDFDQAKSVREMTTNDEANWWIGRLATLKSGSQSYKAALDEANKLMATQQGENLRLRQQRDKATNDYYADPSHFDKEKDPDETKFAADQGKAAGDWLKNLNSSSDIQKQNADAYDEAATKIALASGQISQYDAAQQMASLHTREYTDALNRLQTSLRDIAGDPTLSDLQRKAGLSDVQNQIDSLNGQRAVQAVQDGSSINDRTVGGAFSNTLNQWVQQSTNVADQLHILTDALDSVNESLASSLMAHAHNGHEYRQGIENGLSNSLRGTGTSLLNSSFKNIEGGVLQHFGLGSGKPDGSSNNPLYVRLANGGSSSASSSTGGILGLFGKLFGGKSSSDDDSSSWIDDSGYQGAFASGGDVLANRPALIGEKGPELFMPSTSGSIVPNSALGGTNHVYVDARGSTDEAAVTQAVHRAIGQYAPGTVSASVSAMMEKQKRVPLSRR